MSTRDYATVIFNSLSESELQAFLTVFADDTTLALAESEWMAQNPDKVKHYQSFREIMEELEEEMANE